MAIISSFLTLNVVISICINTIKSVSEKVCVLIRSFLLLQRLSHVEPPISI